MIKSDVPLASGHSLRWFDTASSSPGTFQFTSAAGSIEVICGTTSLGHTSVAFGTNSIKVEVPTVTGATANEAVCGKDQIITAWIKEYSTAIATTTTVADMIVSCMVCETTAGCTTERTATDGTGAAVVVYNDTETFTFKQSGATVQPFLGIQYVTFQPNVKGSYGRFFFKP